MSMIRHTLLALGLSFAATSAFAETVYTFAYSFGPNDSLHVSNSVKNLERVDSFKGADALTTDWHNALASNGYAPVTNSQLGKKLGNYYSSYDEAESKRRAMINGESGKAVKVVNW